MKKQYDTDDMRAAIDTPEWRALAAEYGEKLKPIPGEDRPPVDVRGDRNYSKYFEVDRWLAYHSQHIRNIPMLDEGKSLRILDIGCGSGLFLAMCQHLGHVGVGIDANSQMYIDMARTLGVDYRVELVHRRQPLSADLGEFDLVTAIATKFDRDDFANPKSPVWDTGDWQFLMRDLVSRLRDGGMIYLSPNKWRELDRFPDRDNVIDYLESISSRVLDHDRYIITKAAFLDASA